MLLHQSYTKLTQSLLDTPISGLKYSFYSKCKKRPCSDLCYRFPCMKKHPQWITSILGYIVPQFENLACARF